MAVARSELWLDEIWSLSFARELRAPWQVVTAIHHDNNHPLNTLALAMMVKLAGAHASPLVYRILPLVTGIAMIPLLFWTERSDRARAWLAAVFGAASFMAIVYSSEARGYAPAAFFAVAAFAIIRCHGEKEFRGRLAFAALSVLGVLSHLTFLFPYAGMLAWTFVRNLHSERPAWREWITFHQLPIVFIAGYYLIDASKLVYGGGPPYRIPEVVGRTLSLAIGGPDAGSLKYVAAVLALAVVLWGFWDLVRRKSDEAVFYTVALLIAPAATLIVYKARFLDARYFFVLFPFMWLLAARALARLCEQGTLGRVTAVALLILSSSGSTLNLVPVLRDGRGHYAAAVAMMGSLTKGEEIMVGSNEDFPNRLVLTYYAEAQDTGKKLLYVPSTAWNRERPEWFLYQTFGIMRRDIQPPEHAQGANGKTYRLVDSFRYGGISGWNWDLYHVDDR